MSQYNDEAQLKKSVAYKKKRPSSPLRYVQMGKTYPPEHPEQY